MRKRGALDRRGLIETAIRGRERELAACALALRAARGQAREAAASRKEAVEAELARLREKLEGEAPAEEGPCDGSPRP